MLLWCYDHLLMSLSKSFQTFSSLSTISINQASFWYILCLWTSMNSFEFRYPWLLILDQKGSICTKMPLEMFEKCDWKFKQVIYGRCKKSKFTIFAIFPPFTLLQPILKRSDHRRNTQQKAAEKKIVQMLRFGAKKFRVHKKISIWM